MFINLIVCLKDNNDSLYGNKMEYIVVYIIIYIRQHEMYITKNYKLKNI